MQERTHLHYPFVMASVPQGESSSPRWPYEHAPRDSDADAPVHMPEFQLELGQTTLGQQAQTGPPYDKGSRAWLQDLPIQAYRKHAQSPKFPFSQAPDESIRRPRLLKFAPRDYRRVNHSNANSPVHLTGYQSDLEAALGQQRLIGPSRVGESTAWPQGLPTQAHFNYALEPELPSSRALDESVDVDTSVPLAELSFEFEQAALGQQHLTNPPHDAEFEAWLQGFLNQEHLNYALEPEFLSSRAPEESMVTNTPGLVPATLGQRPLGGERSTPPRVSESEVHLNNTSQISQPVISQSMGAPHQQERCANKAEPRRYTSAAHERKYKCIRCKKAFKRHQELSRHTREVHGSKSDSATRECPYCPPGLRRWKRPSLLKDHLLNDHSKALTKDVFERIVCLQGKYLFEFVDAIELSVKNASP